MGDGGLGAYKQMFNFCLTAGSHGSVDAAGGAVTGDGVREMLAEEREWLVTAMDSFVVDVGKRMRDLVTILAFRIREEEGATKRSGSGMAEVGAAEDADSVGNVLRRIETVEDLHEVQARALEEVDNMTDQIDYARDFCQLGGLRVVMALLRDPTFPTASRATASRALATILQNNPATQAMALGRDGSVEEPLLPSLLELCGDGAAETKLRLATVSALSALVRGTSADAVDVFLSSGGGATLAALLAPSAAPAGDRTTLRLQRKALFLAHFLLCSTDDDAVLGRARDALLAVPPAGGAPCSALLSAARLASSDDPDVQEWAVRVLSAAVVGSPAARLALEGVAPAVNSAARAYVAALRENYADDLEMVSDQMREAVALVAAMR